MDPQVMGQIVWGLVGHGEDFGSTVMEPWEGYQQRRVRSDWVMTEFLWPLMQLSPLPKMETNPNEKEKFGHLCGKCLSEISKSSPPASSNPSRPRAGQQGSATQLTIHTPL